jgi:hypothetical protein
MYRVSMNYSPVLLVSNEVKDSLEQLFEEFRLRESEYIRLSLEKCLYADMQNKGMKPTFENPFGMNA